MFGCVTLIFFKIKKTNKLFRVINRDAFLLFFFCWQTSVFISLLVASFHFQILNCAKKRRKKKEDDPPQPANCSYFICKASNEKYFKWLLSLLYYSVFASCPSAIWQVSLFMNEIGSLSFRFLWWRCIFYSLSFLLFLALFDKKKKKKMTAMTFFFSLSFYILGAAPSFFLLPAASVCVTTLCLFQTCIIIIIIKKMKINHSSDVCSFIYWVIWFFSVNFLGWRRKGEKL